MGAAKSARVIVTHHNSRAFWHPQRGIPRRVFASLHPGCTIANASGPEALKRVHHEGTEVTKLSPGNVAVAVHALVRGGALKQTRKLGNVVSSVARPAAAVGGVSTNEASTVAYRVGRRQASRQVCCLPCNVAKPTYTRRLLREAATLQNG